MAGKGYTTGKWAGETYVKCDQCDYDRVGPNAEADVKQHIAGVHRNVPEASQASAAAVAATSRDGGK